VCSQHVNQEYPEPNSIKLSLLAIDTKIKPPLIPRLEEALCVVLNLVGYYLAQRGGDWLLLSFRNLSVHYFLDKKAHIKQAK